MTTCRSLGHIMRVVSVNDGNVTNVEARDMLQERKSCEIVDLALRYLERQPDQNADRVAQCLQLLRQKTLKPEERIQVVNLAPTNAVTVCAIVDDTRFDDDAVDDIVAVSKTYLHTT